MTNSQPMAEPILLHSKLTSKIFADKSFAFVCFLSILFLFLCLSAITFFIAKTGLLTFKTIPFSEFFLTTNWAPNENHFGAIGFIWGTLVLTFLSLLISLPFSLIMAIFISEIAPKWLKEFINPGLDLLVGIPSIVYGYLGLTVLLPLIRSITGSRLGDGLFAAALVLAIMILPTIARISADSLSNIPQKIRQAAFALGATKTQVIIKCLVPAAKSGITTGIILGMVRAVGETMAVVMVIGNTPNFAKSLFTPTSVLTSNIVMQITNVPSGSTWSNALYMQAFILLIVSLILIVTVRNIKSKNNV